MLTGAFLGLAVGAIMALTGAGGGILAVPLLVFGVHADVAHASPAGLLAVGLAATLGAVLGLRAGIVRYRAALLMALAGAPLSPLGVWLSHQADTRFLGLLFGATMLYVAWRNAIQARDALRGAVRAPAANLPCVRDAASGRFVWTTRCARSLALSGALAGLLSGLLGVGGGFVMVPALQRYTDLPMRSVVATSLAVTALLALAGVSVNVAAGRLDVALALPFAAGALAGLLAARPLTLRLAGPRIQQAFAALCAAVGLLMLGKNLF